MTEPHPGASQQPGGPSAPWSTALDDPDRLIEIARARTDARIEQKRFDGEALRVLCAAFARQSMRHRGKARAHGIVVESLAKAFRTEQYLASYPQIGAATLPAPVVIVGPYRTGTTFLHRLLAQDRRFRWTRTFEVSIAPPATADLRGTADYFVRDPRIALTDRNLRRLLRWNPALESVHTTGATLPEECFGLLESSLCSHSFMFYGDVQPYLDWLALRDESDWLGVYRLYRDQLGLLQWWFPGERWLLKNPAHLWNLDALFAVFPGAHIVQTHRPGARVMGSFLNLLEQNHALAQSTVDPMAIGRLGREYMKTALRRGVAARLSIGDEHFTDIPCEALFADPMACARLIYKRIGLGFDHDNERAMQSWLESRPAVGGAHDYDLNRYGLTAADAEADFEAYAACNAFGFA